MNSAGFLAIVSVAASMLVVSGCKSGASASNTGEGVSAPATTQPPAAGFPAAASHAPAVPENADDARPVLVCFGDSLTAGYGTEPGESYPEQLQRLLDAAGYRYRVVNSGISGNTSKDGLDRLERVLAHHPALVVVEFGGNDGLRGLPLEQTKANLAEMVKRLQDAGATVALAGITLPPDYGKDYIAQLNGIYPALARQFHVRMLPFLLKDVYGVPGDMQEDQTHATAKGNRQVAVNVEQLVLPLLKK